MQNTLFGTNACTNAFVNVSKVVVVVVVVVVVIVRVKMVAVVVVGREGGCVYCRDNSLTL
jgi:hypothetical protein